jgi:hypothetical protein
MTAGKSIVFFFSDLAYFGGSMIAQPNLSVNIPVTVTGPGTDAYGHVSNGGYRVQIEKKKSVRSPSTDVAEMTTN